MERVSILDLTIEDVEDIERSVGARMTEWPEGVGRIADLYARIYQKAHKDETLEEVKQRSLSWLTESVTLGEDDETPDPT